MKLSVVINTKNSAETLKKTLESVKFADEIVVVDMNSADDTVKIAKEFTSKVFQHKDTEYVEPARNFAISKASHDWVLIVDSDEQVSTGLKNFIQRVMKSKKPADIYLIPRLNYIFGEKMRHTGWWPDYQPRLFQKGKLTWPKKIHQHPELVGEVQKLPAEESLSLVHQNYADVNSYLERLIRYTSIQAQNEAEGFVEQINATKIISGFFEEFFKRFFVLSGYQDQTVGTGLSFLQAMYEVVVKLKLWEMQQDNDLNQNTTPKQSSSEIITALETGRRHLNYWLADWRVKNNTGLKQVYWKIRRKFQI